MKLKKTLRLASVGVIASAVFVGVGAFNRAYGLICDANDPVSDGVCTNYSADCAGDAEYPPGVYTCLSCNFPSGHKLLCGYLTDAGN